MSHYYVLHLFPLHIGSFHIDWRYHGVLVIAMTSHSGCQEARYSETHMPVSGMLYMHVVRFPMAGTLSDLPLYGCILPLANMFNPATEETRHIKTDSNNLYSTGAFHLT